MICQMCKIEGKKSRVESVPITCMTMEMKYDYSFWDEEGEYHNHNHSKAHYKCSNAHEFIITTHCQQCKECCKI